jgi:UDP-N-acetylmuramate dehydrogenase
MAGNLVMAEILHRGNLNMPPVREAWLPDRLEFTYRGSAIKRQRQLRAAQEGQWPDQPQTVVLAAVLQLDRGDGRAIQETVEAYVKHRRRTQPPGASMGSMFKNPAGDFAGRLIEAAGLKGKRIGDAEISPLHANFFVNHGQAAASDIWALIQLARREVADRFGILLELEIELLGTWN